MDALLARAVWTRGSLGDPTAAEEAQGLGADPEVASSPPPSYATKNVATTETAPVPVATSLADAVAKGQALRAQDFYEDAVRVLRDAEARYGPDAPVRLETAWNLLMIAEEDVTRNVEKSKIDAEVVPARRTFEEALRLDPKVAGQDLLQLKLLRYEGANELAHALGRSLAAREPDVYEVRREYADLAYLTGDWVTAEREYQAAYRLRPQDGWALLYATMSSQWLEKPAATLEAGYLEAARRLPDEPMAYERLATLYAADPEKDQALLERAVVQSPKTVAGRISLARLLSSRGAFDRAEARLLEALAISPASVAVKRELARVANGTGHASLALERELEALEAADATEAASIADELDAWLQDLGFRVAADARLRAWQAVVDRFPNTGKYAHDASVWYSGVGANPEAAAHFRDEAARAEPTREDYRKDAAPSTKPSK